MRSDPITEGYMNDADDEKKIIVRVRQRARCHARPRPKQCAADSMPEFESKTEPKVQVRSKIRAGTETRVAPNAIIGHPAVHNVGELMAYTRKMIKEHNLHGWDVQICNSTTCMGLCKYDIHRIVLSRFCLKMENREIIDTVLHEIAHAMLPAGEGHSKEWVRVAKSIGCTARVEVPRAKIKFKHIVVCSEEDCTYKVGRHRLDKRFLTNYVCPECNGALKELK